MRIVALARTVVTNAWDFVTARWAGQGHMEWLDDDEVAQMQAWSISARLAAVPAGYMASVPDDLACLIKEAKRLHPVMAEGADRRDEEKIRRTFRTDKERTTAIATTTRPA